jgi:hypothetical protein
MFSDRAKLIALAIVHIFETSKPFGDYSAVAVLNDGAGISYGINQFTHRSGSLYQVVTAYLNQNPSANIEIITRALPMLRLTTEAAILSCSNNTALKNALQLAGATVEMRTAQQRVMTDRYLTPAIEACEGSNFTLPLSLAVIYDSINHGSYDLIRDRDTVTHENLSSQVTVDRTDHGNSENFEKAWISEYVRLRDHWLASVPRLAGTRYRTRLFLNQIKSGNWNLALPIVVQGVRLTDAMINVSNSAAVPVVKPTPEGTVSGAIKTANPNPPEPMPEIGQPPTNLTTAETQQVQKQKPSVTTLLVSLGTAIYGAIMFAQTYFGSIYNKAVDAIDGKIIAWGLLEIAIIALGIWLWNYSHRSADASTAQLVEKAADPASNTVELKK